MSTKHEVDRDVRIPWVLGVGLGTLSLAILAGAVSWLIFATKRAALSQLDPLPRPVPEALSKLPPSGPRLQVWPKREIAAYRAAQEELLKSYGPLDKQEATARIPIDRAMELYVIRSMRAAPSAPSGGKGEKP